ncbi:MAG: hypothetical protein KKF67_00040 [Nanoarchaeota archaeon]|nr:hypothetical protein [Nanoarchaeota archaeon]
MVDQALVEGLKNALTKGESLQSAMQSFLNAGYNSSEVEEASRNLQTPTAIFQKTNAQVMRSSKPIQQVSEYSGESTGPSKALIIILIIFLVLVVSSLVGILIFKNEVISLLSKLF